MEPEPTKVCLRCGEALPLYKYRRDPCGRLRSICVDCDSTRRRELAAADREYQRKLRAARPAVCRRCGEARPPSAFPMANVNRGSVCSDCRASEAVVESMKKHRRPGAPRVSEERTEDGNVIRVSCGRFCRLCFGLPHRVRGEVCSSCGLKKGEAP
jgi:hypothetical protein